MRYAVRAADLASGDTALRLVGSAPAGGSYDQEVGPGEAVRIFTGGLLPRGADAVALQENARAEGERVHIEAVDRSRGTLCVPPGSTSGETNVRCLRGVA